MANLTWQQVVGGINCSIQFVWLLGALVQHKYLFPVSYFTCVQDGLSPVYAASQEGYTEVVDLLVQAGADIHLATTDEVHVSTHTVSSSVAAVVGTDHTHKRGNMHC